MSTNSQAGQDIFVLRTLKNKKNGFFIEIGSDSPNINNNTYILEKEYNWKGLMVEQNKYWIEHYKKDRSNSYHIFNDARNIDYISFFNNNNFPKNIDYLQIDLDVNNRSTLDVLEKFDKTIFNNYKFATITFEHDIYTGDYFNTRIISRDIFIKNGYFLVFPDVKVNPDVNLKDKMFPFEDWYVHPDLVDMNYINKIKSNDSLTYHEIVDILKK